MTTTEQTTRYRIIGMDCSDDAREIEKAARNIDSVQDVRVSVASQVMTLRLSDARIGASEVERAITDLGYQLDRLSGDGLSTTAQAEPTTHMTATYQRALWIVVLLNVGYGLVEIVGGFLSDSQALKADALDFFGDGVITLIGVIAIGWGLKWRARSAHIQGIFLGALGLGVLGTHSFVSKPDTKQRRG